MQLASTSTPRSATSSVTCSYDSGYRRYQRTHKTITSPGYWRPLNGLCGLIGMDFYPIRLPAPKFATEPGTVQWTARSPFRPEHKRKNWFVGVDVLEPFDETRFNPRDVRLDTIRASGTAG